VWRRWGKRLDAAGVRVEDADVVTVVIFHDDVVAVKTTLCDPFIGLLLGDVNGCQNPREYGGGRSSADAGSR
jgi:hypothetical protein